MKFNSIAQSLGADESCGVNGGSGWLVEMLKIVALGTRPGLSAIDSVAPSVSAGAGPLAVQIEVVESNTAPGVAQVSSVWHPGEFGPEVFTHVASASASVLTFFWGAVPLPAAGALRAVPCRKSARLLAEANALISPVVSLAELPTWVVSAISMNCATEYTDAIVVTSLTTTGWPGSDEAAPSASINLIALLAVVLELGFPPAAIR